LTPLVVGLKVTLKVQLDAGLSELPQGLTPLPTAMKLPLVAQEIFCVEAALFVIATVMELLVLPTVVVGNVREGGETAIGSSPEPANAIRCGAPFTPLSTMLITPAIEPPTVGENITLMVQDEPPAIGLPLTQLSVSE
jgi:hypothetical protein